MAANEPYVIECTDSILTVTFNRPDQGNALPPEAVPSLITLFRSINSSTSIKAVLICGAGRNFSAGGDVGIFAKSLREPFSQRRAEWHQRQTRLMALVQAYTSIEVPVIACCQGGVIGAGLLFALGADYVVADETVVFAFSQQRLGLTPDGGISFLLPRAVGRRRAALLVLTAARVKADEALQLGLVHKIADAESREREAKQLARRLAAAPADVVRNAKRMMATEVSLTEALTRERAAIVESVCRPDFEEGVRAFLEKREPEFGKGCG
jgi:2-(1,2-epoxy-1,2-dihydrophenyl)acetyl-CoA isomerase